MPDQRTSENWRLEEGGKGSDKWLLQESEQQLADQWKLEGPAGEPISSWQPVEYVKTPRPAGTWILPTIITLALLVTLGYAGYRVLPAIFNGGDATPAPQQEAQGVTTGVATSAPSQEATAAEPTVAASQEPAQKGVVVPTASADAATPTPAATMVDQQFAVVNSPFGVNSRSAADTNAPVIRVLENGEELFVFGQQGNWIELFVADTPLTEGQTLSGTVGFAATEFFTVSTKQITQGLRDQILAYAGKLPTATPEAAAPVVPPAAGGTSITETASTSSTTSTAPVLTVTINAINGVNVRRQAASDDTNVIRLLENGTVLPAIGRSADSKWIQVALPDGLSGWISADFLVPSADIATLPVKDGTVASPVGATGATTTTAPVGSTIVVTSGTKPPAPYTDVIPANNAPAIIVTVPDGVNARKEPALESDVQAVVPQGAVLPATGRSADNQWVQVQLPTGVEAWIFRDTVTATPAVGALPAVGGPTAVPILLPTPTPNPGTPAPANTAPTAAATPASTTGAATPASTSVETATVSAKVVPFFLPVYSGPNNTSETVARSPRGSDFVVIGKNADGSWLQVTTDAGVTGWVVAGNVRVTGDLSTVPVVK